MGDEYDTLLQGIQYAESRGQPDPFNAVGDNGQARGAFQVHPIMYQDIQQTYPHRWGSITYEQMLASPDLQKAMAHDGMKMLHEKYGLSGDALLSAWNTGPTQARKGVMKKDYVATAKAGMGKNTTMRRFP